MTRSTTPASPQPVQVSGPAPGVVHTLEVVLPGAVEPDGLQLRTRELPALGRGEALVAVEATGISFAEQAMRRKRYPGQPRFPFVPGYDVVGRVVATGSGVSTVRVGARVAALTKTGGWASHVVLPAADLLDVPEGLDAAEVETLVVNGITAWQMLHRTARVRPGQVVLVQGANGGVGTTLAQLARHHGVRVIGSARPQHHESLRAIGVEPVDGSDPATLEAQVRELAPGGVDAVFDILGGESLHRSWRLLAPHGSLVSSSLASVTSGSLELVFVRLLLRLAAWDLAPNGRRAVFYDVWSGHLLRPRRFRTHLRSDLAAVLALLAGGALVPQVAARLPLTEVVEALRLAEARTRVGKVVLLP